MAVNLSIFNSNKYLRFFAQLILFSIFMILVDHVGGSVLKYFYSKTLYGDNWPKGNWVTQKKFDVIIFGSSRTFRHYIPSLIEKKIDCTVFNAGENGQYLLYSYALEQLVLHRYTPRAIVLDLLPSYIIKLDNEQEEFDRLESLAPYLDEPEIRSLLIRGKLLNRIKYFSRLYRFNSRILNIADNIRNGPGNFDNGYVSIGVPKFRPTNKFLIDLMQVPRVDSFKINILKKFISSAREKNVQVIMSFSPTLEPLSANSKKILTMYQHLFSSLDVPFIDILSADHPEFENKAFFMDYIHMNARGAEHFSELFSQQLAGVLLRQKTLTAGLEMSDLSIQQDSN